MALQETTQTKKLTADEWALLQTLRLDFCRRYCPIAGTYVVIEHVSGCIETGKILAKLKEDS